MLYFENSGGSRGFERRLLGRISCPIGFQCLTICLKNIVSTLAEVCTITWPSSCIIPARGGQ